MFRCYIQISNSSTESNRLHTLSARFHVQKQKRRMKVEKKRINATIEQCTLVLLEILNAENVFKSTIAYTCNPLFDVGTFFSCGFLFRASVWLPLVLIVSRIQPRKMCVSCVSATCWAVFRRLPCTCKRTTGIRPSHFQNEYKLLMLRWEKKKTLRTLSHTNNRPIQSVKKLLSIEN